MIDKLRKKLMVMFLTSTVLIFTLAMLVMMGNSVISAQTSEIQYVNNLADSVLDQINSGKDIDNVNLVEYSSKAKVWISLTDGLTTQKTPECLITSSEVLLKRMLENSSLLSGIQVVGTEMSGEARTVHSFAGMEGEPYYGIHSTTYKRGASVVDLILIYPHSTVWEILQRNCTIYPIVWLVVVLLLYALSRFLIKKAIQPVERAMKSQKEFIASASHELKAPLAVIQANAEALEIEEVNSHKKKVILDECTRMGTLIQSLLALASSDAGNWKMNIQETNVDTLLIESWDAFSESARKKNIRLDLNIEEHYPTILCDKDRINQVIGILLDNAISYSPSGLTIEMGATVQGKQFVLYVIDHGSGIPDSEKEKVFQRFYSGDPSRTNKGHYGLGLSIAQEIVNLHQGSLRLKDTPDGGCTFTIHLPIE